MATRPGSEAEPIERYPTLGSFGGACTSAARGAPSASRKSARTIGSNNLPLLARRRGRLPRQPDGGVARVVDGAAQDRQHEIVCGERVEGAVHVSGATAVRRPDEERHA